MRRPGARVKALWLVAGLLLVAGAGSSLLAAREGVAVQVPAEAAAPPGTGGETAAGQSGGEVEAPTPGSGEASAAAVPVTVSSPLQIGRADGGLDTHWLARLRSLVGMFVLGFIAWLLSVNRKAVPWRVVLWGIALQLVFAFFILKTPLGLRLFQGVNDVVVALLGFTVDGARFIFGNLVDNNVPVGTGTVGNGPFTAMPGQVANTGAYFAFTVLPTIIFFSSLMTVLYHLGVMQLVVKGFAWIMQRTMKTSGAETLSAAGNIFVGQTEAPLLIRPFIEKMTMSELMAVMTGGFATVAGGVMAAYVGFLIAYFPDIAGHLMAASVMSAPAALVMAKLMYPEDGTPQTGEKLELDVARPDVNVIDAASRGAADGLQLALNVGAMLMAFVALVYLLNGLLGWSGSLVGIEGLTLERILGWVIAPLAWIMGVPWADAPVVGSLLGIKTVLNEFFAYIQLSGILGSSTTSLQPRSVIIASYALAGFANFSSIAIQLGGIGPIAPSRRHDLSRIGLRAMIAGTLAAFMTATVAGMIL